MSWLERLMFMIERNYEFDPWIEAIDVEEGLREIEEEIEEVREAIRRNDKENLEEEIGDLIWTAFMTMLVSFKRGLDPEKVVKKLEDKMKKRKPYIFEGFKPSLEEAKKIWREAKGG